jgi:signal transduction histidine kinase
VYITDVDVDTLNVTQLQHYEVPPDHAVLTFHFAGLSFSDERQVRYKYKLEGFDRNWSSPVQTREVRYTHLPSGKYTFLVLARSRDRVWSTRPASFSFTVLAPIWARWWFVSFSLLALSSAIYAGYRYRLNKLLELERTRSRIAMDLHDDIGSSLTRISVLSEVARYQENAQHDEARETIRKIGDTARELIDALGDIVWSVDPKHDDLQGVIRRIVQFGQETCEGRNIQFETDLKGEYSATKLSLDQRRDVFLIFKEAVNNIVKHSGATRVSFQATPNNSGVVLELRDDGSGFDESDAQSGNGLPSMRRRGDRIGGLSITSRVGRGTSVSILLKTV